MEAPVQREFTCAGPDQLDTIAAEILRTLGGPRVVAFHGPLGAGKTALIKALCRQLGVADTAASPTFAIIHEYAGLDGEPVYHFDLFRIASETELYDLGYEQYFYSGRYCFIEWAEKAQRLLPPGAASVSISVSGPVRTITLSI